MQDPQEQPEDSPIPGLHPNRGKKAPSPPPPGTERPRASPTPHPGGRAAKGTARPPPPPWQLLRPSPPAAGGTRGPRVAAERPRRRRGRAAASPQREEDEPGAGRADHKERERCNTHFQMRHKAPLHPQAPEVREPARLGWGARQKTSSAGQPGRDPLGLPSPRPRREQSPLSHGWGPEINPVD